MYNPHIFGTFEYSKPSLDKMSVELGHMKNHISELRELVRTEPEKRKQHQEWEARRGKTKRGKTKRGKIS